MSDPEVMFVQAKTKRQDDLICRDELFVPDYNVQRADYIHLLVQRRPSATSLGQLNPDRIIPGQPLPLCLPAITLSPFLQPHVSSLSSRITQTWGLSFSGVAMYSTALLI